MPTIKYHSGHFSRDGVEWDIYIDDTSYSGSQNEFTTDGRGFVLEYDDPDSNEFERPMGSRVTVPFLVQDSSDENFLLSLVGASEERFKIRIDRGGNLYWVGFVVADEVVIQDAYYPYLFDIVAVDGLGRLKNEDYNDAGTAYSGKETFLEHFTNVFGKLPFAYFHSSANFFESVIDWYELQHTVVGGLDPLTVTRFDHSVFIETDNKGVKTYKSCYDVLKLFCTIWGARLYFSDGTWRFEQINARESASFQEVRYDETFTLINYANTSYEITIDQSVSYAREAGGEWGFWPPLNKVCLNYKHEHDENLLLGTEWFHNNTTEQISDYTAGNVDVGDGNVKLLFSSTLHYTNTHLSNTFLFGYQHVFRFKLKVGNYWLNRKRYEAGTGILPVPYSAYWTTDESYYEVISHFINPVNSGNNSVVNGALTVNFVTPVIYETGDLIFSLDHLVAVESGTSNVVSSSVYELVWDLDGHAINVLPDGEQTSRENERKYCAVYTGSGNNVEELHYETIIGDGPFKTSFSKLEVSDGSSWLYSGDWRVADVGTQFTIQDLVVREILSRQKVPLRKYIGTLKGNIVPQHRIFIDPYYLLFNGGSFTSNLDEWSSTWMVIDKDNTQIDIADPEIVGNKPKLIDFELSDDDNLVGDTDESPATTGLLVQTTNYLYQSIESGFNETIPIKAAGSALYQEGDYISIVNPTTGAYETVQVQVDMQEGDTEIFIYTTLNNNYPSNAYVIPNAEQNEPDDQLSAEIVTSFFEAGAAITDPEYFLNTTAKVPTVEYIILLKGTSNWSVTTPADFYTVPPLYDGAIMTTYVAAKTAGTGSGNNTLLIKQNAATVATHNLAAAAKTSTDTTEITLATGDEIEFDITGITGSTAAQGLTVYLTITPGLNVDFKKIKYTLNRVITDNQVLWWKMNQSAMVPIGVGSILFDDTQRIDMGEPASLDITGDHTIMGWAKFEGFGSENCIIGTHDGTQGTMIYTKSTAITFLVNLTNTCSINATGNVALYKWHHYAATLSGTDAKIYMDGKLMDTATYSAPTTNSVSFAIGAYNTTLGSFDGNITKCGVWGAALTGDQINSIMNKSYSQFTTSEKTDLISWWDLNDLTDVEDKHAGNDGTVTTI
jgi:hypothetical protein